MLADTSLSGKYLKVKRSSLACAVIFIYMIVYEWGIFEAIPNTLMYPIKMLLPLLLLFFPIKKLIKNNTYYNNFLLCYFLFILWSLIPSLFGGSPEESITQWLKFMSRFVFFILASRYLLKNKEANLVVMKCFVITGIFSVIQYVLLWFFSFNNIFSFTTLELGRGIYYGPFGLLGNVSSLMNLPGIPTLFRFHGFWLEPSRASGFMFACYFLASNLYFLENKIFWKRASYACLLGGLLCFSNAGYLAIAMALLFGLILNVRLGQISFFNFSVKTGLALLLVFLALFGRSYVAENFIDNDIARAVAGVRGGSCAGTKCGGLDYSSDPSAGRLGHIKMNFEIAKENPMGLGIRVTGKYDKKSGFTNSGGNALIEWLLYTGFIGLFLILLREAQVLIFTFKYKDLGMPIIYLSQAWIALFFQNLLYGNIMTPAYLLVIIFLFAARKNSLLE